MNESHDGLDSSVDVNFRVANFIGVAVAIVLPVLAILLICYRTKLANLAALGAISARGVAILFGVGLALVLASRFVWQRKAANYLDSRNSVVAACRIAHIAASMVIGLPCLAISALFLRIQPESFAISTLLLAISPIAYSFLPGKGQWHSLLGARSQA